MKFLSSIPLWVKADPTMDKGVGDKYILRQVALLLGLNEVMARL